VDIEPQSQERPIATETASVWSIAVQVAAYAGVAMGLVGTGALVATSIDPSDTTLLLVGIAVTTVLFAAGIAIGGEPISSNQRLRSVLWFAALLGWGFVVEAILAVAEINPEGRFLPLLSAALVAPVAVGLWLGLRKSLQVLGMVSVLYVVLSAALFPQPDPFGRIDLVATAVLTWVFGAVWMALGARGVIEPSRTTLVLGTITVLVAPFVLAVGGQASESTLTVVELWVLAGGILCLTVGSWLADRAVQGLAIVSVLVGVAVLSADLLGDSEGGQIAAVVLGIALLAGAVVAIRMGAGTPSEPTPPAPAGVLPEPPMS
jgi:peptidoglycan/LPS O-acetylase OafA/YrhL